MSCKPLSRELAHTTLQEYGPMTKADLLDLLGDKGKTAAQAIFTARSDYPGQYFHIVGYEPQRGRKGHRSDRTGTPSTARVILYMRTNCRNRLRKQSQ